MRSSIRLISMRLGLSNIRLHYRDECITSIVLCVSRSLLLAQHTVDKGGGGRKRRRMRSREWDERAHLSSQWTRGEIAWLRLKNEIWRRLWGRKKWLGLVRWWDLDFFSSRSINIHILQRFCFRKRLERLTGTWGGFRHHSGSLMQNGRELKSVQPWISEWLKLAPKSSENGRIVS